MVDPAEAPLELAVNPSIANFWTTTYLCRDHFMNKLTVMILAAFAAVALPALGASHPNIVYILADDLGYGDLGCYGQTTLSTPNIDRLAGEGMRFTRHYAGNTVCAPSRGVLMTGLHTGHGRIRGNGDWVLPDDDLTVPKLLKQAGYTTACFGKYGVGKSKTEDDPKRKGFDEFFGYIDTSHAHNFYPAFLVRNGERVLLNNVQIAGSGKGGHEGKGVATQEGRKQWAPGLISEEMQKYLQSQKGNDKPFFLYYALNLPHANNEAGKDSPLGHGLESPNYGEFSNKDWPDVEKGFAQFIRFVDNEVGAIAAAIQKMGLDDDTIIMFSSDNGPHAEGLHDSNFFRSNGGLNGIKRAMTDGGIRVPLIVRWPHKVSAGAVTEHVSGFQDLLPTVAALAGVTVTAECDGLSMLPTLLGKGKQEQHPYLYWEFDEQGGKSALLKWPWKLIHLNTEAHNPRNAAGKTKSLEVALFNLAEDSGEATNFAAARPELVAELEKDMKDAHRSPVKDSGGE
jgi:arylsulfatase A-like enzyme